MKTKSSFFEIIELIGKGLGALLIGIAGIFFTVTNNNRQHDLKELELLLKIEPLINSGDVKKVEYGFNIVLSMDEGAKISRLIAANKSRAVVEAGKSILAGDALPDHLKAQVQDSITRAELILEQNIGAYVEKLIITREISRVLLDHSWAPSMQATRDNGIAATMFTVKVAHVRERGWSDVGAHFHVFYDGTIGIGRDINRDPAASRGNNKGSLAIVLMIDSETEIPTPEMLRSFARLLRAFDEKKNSEEKLTFDVNQDIFEERGFERNIFVEVKASGGLGNNVKASGGPGKNVKGVDVRRSYLRIANGS